MVLDRKTIEAFSKHGSELTEEQEQLLGIKHGKGWMKQAVGLKVSLEVLKRLQEISSKENPIHSQINRKLRTKIKSFENYKERITFPMSVFIKPLRDATRYWLDVEMINFNIDVENELTICNLITKKHDYKMSFNYKTNIVSVWRDEGEVKEVKIEDFPSYLKSERVKKIILKIKRK